MAGRGDIPVRMPFRAFISGCSGPELTNDEFSFFREARPCGLILFARNCKSPEKLLSKNL